MPTPGQEETVRVVALDRSFHLQCYRYQWANKYIYKLGFGHFSVYSKFFLSERSGQGFFNKWKSEQGPAF